MRLHSPKHSKPQMKPTLSVFAGLLATAACFAADPIKINIDPGTSAQPAPAAQPAKPAAAPATGAAQQAPVPQYVVPADGKYTNEQKIEVYGYLLARRLNLRDEVLPMLQSNEEVTAFLNGVGRALIGDDLPYDPRLVLPQSQELLNARKTAFNAQVEKQRTEVNERNQKEAKEFLAKLDATPGVKKTSSGLRYEIIKEGTGAKAKPEQAVRAFFKTSLITGEVIAASKDKDGKDVAVELALGPAFPGLKEGLQLTGVGGKLKLYVPAELAFGDQGAIPGALTIFEIEIVEVKEPTKEPEQKK